MTAVAFLPALDVAPAPAGAAVAPLAAAEAGAPAGAAAIRRLFAESRWEAVQQLFRKECLRMQGQLSSEPLVVGCAAPRRSVRPACV